MAGHPYSVAGLNRSGNAADHIPLRVAPKFDHGPADGVPERRRRLRPVVDREVLPRLLLAHLPPCCAVTAPPAPDHADLHGFADALLAADHDRACAIVDMLRAAGTSLETLYVDLLAPAGHRLRRLWIEDRCDFAGLTQGLSLLRALLGELRPAFCGEVMPSVRGRAVLLSPAPGEKVTFEHVMVEEFFRRAGWTVCSVPAEDGSSLSARAHESPFDVVWLSHSAHGPLDGLAACIRDMRQESCNPDMGVMVGGTEFASDPARARLVGAHATAADGRDAESQAQTLVCLLAGYAGFRRRPYAATGTRAAS